VGISNGIFIKYPRTPHLFGSKGTDDDKHMGEAESLRFASDPSLIVEEKLDGTNVGIHFKSDGEMVLQCRGHLIAEGEADAKTLDRSVRRLWSPHRDRLPGACVQRHTSAKQSARTTRSQSGHSRTGRTLRTTDLDGSSSTDIWLTP
jgi:hypothetical protein